MIAVSELGYTPVYVGFLLVLSFSLRLRPALGVLLGLMLAVVMTEGLKAAIAFPRPSDIDAAVQTGPMHTIRLPALDAGGFWSLPSDPARDAIRARPNGNYGFPSGHVGAAMAFCLGLALLFRLPRRLAALAFTWPLIMGLSRMYLGRHFLADVLRDPGVPRGTRPVRAVGRGERRPTGGARGSVLRARRARVPGRLRRS
jgi:membrane-associated phospholipid phosphatase